MSNKAHNLTLSDVCQLEVIGGPQKGIRVELAGESMTMGRAADNDIVVAADGVSRQHAMLVFSQGAWFIRDNGSKNGLLVNGQKVRESWLESGDVIQVGGSIYRFSAPTEMDPVESPAPLVTDAMQVTGTVLPKTANRRPLIYGVLGVVLLMLYLFGGEPQPGSTDDQPAAEGARLERDFDTGKEPDGGAMTTPSSKILGLEDPVLKKAEQEMTKLDWSNTALRESEQFFRRGQREYMTKNYHRAIESFQTALALYRGHLLADRYLRRAVYEVEIEAKTHMETAVRYFDALQYQRAIYHFSETVTLMAHRPNEKIVAEANRYIEQAKKRLKAAELFP